MKSLSDVVVYVSSVRDVFGSATRVQYNMDSWTHYPKRVSLADTKQNQNSLGISGSHIYMNMTFMMYSARVSLYFDLMI